MSELNQPGTEDLSPFEILVNIYTNPTRAFGFIKTKQSWLFPVILSIIVGTASSFLINDIVMEAQKNKILQSERIPEERKDMFLEEFENPNFMRQYGFGFLGVVFYVFAGYALGALVFMGVGNFMMGGETSFRENFALFAWGSQIGILESLVKVPLILSKQSLEVYTSLAVFLDPSQSETIMFKIMDSIDIFAIWKIIVFSIGFGIIYNFSKGKSYAAIISLYVLYTIFAVGLSQLFGSFI